MSGIEEESSNYSMELFSSSEGDLNRNIPFDWECPAPVGWENPENPFTNGLHLDVYVMKNEYALHFDGQAGLLPLRYIQKFIYLFRKILLSVKTSGVIIYSLFTVDTLLKISRSSEVSIFLTRWKCWGWKSGKRLDMD